MSMNQNVSNLKASMNDTFRVLDSQKEVVKSMMEDVRKNINEGQGNHESRITSLAGQIHHIKENYLTRASYSDNSSVMRSEIEKEHNAVVDRIRSISDRVETIEATGSKMDITLEKHSITLDNFNGQIISLNDLTSKTSSTVV